MLDLTTSRSIVEKYLGTNFTTCPIRFENVGMPEEAATWISLTDKQDISGSTGLGETSAVINGSLIIGIFTILGIGTTTARSIAEELSDLLGNQELEGIAFQEPIFHGSPGGNSDIPWYQMNLVIPYTSILGQNYSS